MKRTIALIAVVMMSCFGMLGCQNRMAGTALGGATGAGLGYAVTGGSPIGAGVGAVGGAVVGNALSR